MDTEITKLIQALRGISNKLEEIYGKPTEAKEKVEQSLQVQNPMQDLQMQKQAQSSTEIAPVNSTFTSSGSFELAHKETQSLAPVATPVPPTQEAAQDTIRRLENELTQLRHQNINFNFAPTAIGGTYGQSNY